MVTSALQLLKNYCERGYLPAGFPRARARARTRTRTRARRKQQESRFSSTSTITSTAVLSARN